MRLMLALALLVVLATGCGKTVANNPDASAAPDASAELDGPTGPTACVLGQAVLGGCTL